jgi:nitrite reductase/ring-hydroxylating ferredoxin subunit
MTRFVVAEVDEIPDGSNKVVTVKGRPIVVFNLGGEFFALLNRCPHEGAALCKGARIGLTRSGEAGTYDYSRPGEMVRCPWHGWEFDLRTGQSYCDPQNTTVRAFKASVEDGETLEKGPYVAETFKVSVANRYILVEV